MSDEKVTRREALSLFAMSGGLLVSMGYLANIAVKYLTPRKGLSELKELFIGKGESIAVDSSRVYHDLRGGEVIVLRTGEGFKGFTNVCPHLGCHVHWEQEERIFFCPCHLGKFDADGIGIEGPPADAAQVLASVEIRYDENSDNLFMRVPGRVS